MQKDLTFLAVDGKLTSSSAAHLRDLAASKATEIISALGQMKFVNKYVQLIGSVDRNLTHKGYSGQDIQRIPEDLEKIAVYYAFEAWMNEAIEAKRNLFDELKKLTLEEWAKLKGIELPVEPKSPRSKDVDDYLATLTIKERNRWFTLQAKVSSIGKLIHDGPFARAMKEFQSAKSNPITEVLNGRDTILHISEPSVDSETVNEVYYKLQNTHREYQAQFNGMKEAMDKFIKEDSMKATSEYREAYSAYRTQIAEYQTQLTQYKQEMSAELEKLKIVIPEHLMGVYRELAALGK